MTTPREKIRSIIYEEQTKKPNCSLAIVNKTHEDTYTCDILAINNNNPNLGGQMNNVPLPYIGGMTYSMPHVGDKVLVEFLGGDFNFPYIVAVYPTLSSQIKNISKVPVSLSKLISNTR